MNESIRSKLMALAASAALAGCATVGPNYQRESATAVPKLPAAWQAALPHSGSTGELADWWARFDDALLVDLIRSAQTESGSVAAAASRIEQAYASAVAANAAGLPTLDANVSATRGPLVIGVGSPILRTQVQGVLQSGWEIDLFGALARNREATRARVEARGAEWHDARVSIAAETANLYAQYRACEQQVALSEADANSRAETARLTDQLARAGFQSPANAALARASAAEAAGRLLAQRAECDIAIKGLVALTTVPEAELRARLAADRAKLPEPAKLAVEAVPAAVLAQRPDLAALEREMAAASADIGSREAERYPRLSLTGSIGPARVRAFGNEATFRTWSIGPSVTLPIFDGGRRKANVEAARAAYDAAAANYRDRARRAVREVEEALVRLGSVEAREADAVIAVAGYRTSLNAAEQRWKSGLGTQIELEDQRRLAVAADATLAGLRRDRVLAWIALYRAVGGGWQATDPSPLAAAPRSTQ